MPSHPHPCRRLLVAALALPLAGLALSGCGDGTEREVRETEIYPEEALELQVSTPERIRAGTQYLTEVTLTNHSEHPMHAVTLHRWEGQHGSQPTPDRRRAQERPDHSEPTQSWSVGSLDPGATTTVSLERVSQEEGVLSSCWTASYQPGVCTRVVAVAPELRLQRQGLAAASAIEAEDHTVYACDQIELTYVLRNEGKIALEPGTIREDLPPGITTAEGEQQLRVDFPRIEPGDTIERRVTLDPQEPGRYTFATRAESGGTTVRAAEETVVVLEPELELRLEGPPEAYLDQPVTYTAILRNTGDDPAIETSLQIRGLDGLKRVSAGGDYRRDGDRIVVGRLDGNSERRFSFTGVPGEKGEIQVAAVAEARCVERLSQRVTTSVSGVPALRLEAVDTHDPVAVGDTTTYTIQVKNQGSAEDLAVDLAMALPEGMSFVSGDGPSAVEARDDGTIQMGRLERIGAGEVVEWTVEAKAEQPGAKRMKMQLTSKDVRTPLIEQEPTTVIADDRQARTDD